MKKILVLLNMLIFASSLTEAQTIAEIVDKHLAARGGTEKIKSVKSVVTENTIRVQGMDIQSKTSIQIGKGTRTDSRIMDNDLVQAYDGQTAWNILPAMMGGTGEPQVMTKEMAQDIIAQIDPFPFIDYTAKGTRILLLGTEKIKDKDAFHLKLISKENIESESWISTENYLLVKLSTKQMGSPIELFFSNNKEIDGIIFPLTIETSSPMAGTIIIDTKSVLLNSSIDENIFKMPVK